MHADTDRIERHEIRITGAEREDSGHEGAEAISHLGTVVAVGLLGDLPPKHHLPEFLRRLQCERGIIRDRRSQAASPRGENGGGTGRRRTEERGHLVRPACWQRPGAIGVRPREQAGRRGVGTPHGGRPLHLPAPLLPSLSLSKGRKGLEIKANAASSTEARLMRWRKWGRNVGKLSHQIEEVGPR